MEPPSANSNTPSTTPIQAFQASDLNALVELVRKTPTGTQVAEILDAYEALATADPGSADKYNILLRDLQAYPDMPTILLDEEEQDGPNHAETFTRYFKRTLFETIKDLLAESTHTSCQVTPTNQYLVACLISGSALGTEACFSSTQVGHILDGLQIEGVEYANRVRPEDYEVEAVGGLIQVLAGAKKALEVGWMGEGELKRALDRIGGVIHSDSGKKVLEVTQALALDGFQESLGVKGIFGIFWTSSKALVSGESTSGCIFTSEHSKHRRLSAGTSGSVFINKSRVWVWREDSRCKDDMAGGGKACKEERVEEGGKWTYILVRVRNGHVLVRLPCHLDPCSLTLSVQPSDRARGGVFGGIPESLLTVDPIRSPRGYRNSVSAAVVDALLP
ncbi:hypothetical protein NMY22_g16889 [Coprinellus aureogranulatus]|nr:hypothetical protein NMY22_g16889 [Coprinellus aureogranulatus]